VVAKLKGQLKGGNAPRLQFKADANGVVSYQPAAAAAAISSAEQEEGRLGDVLRKVHESTGVHLAPSQCLSELMLDSLGTGRLVHELRNVLPLKTSELFGDASVEVRVTRSSTHPCGAALMPCPSRAMFRSLLPPSTRAMRRRVAPSSPSPRWTSSASRLQ
jgi:hypothetical protein